MRLPNPTFGPARVGRCNAPPPKACQPHSLLQFIARGDPPRDDDVCAAPWSRRDVQDLLFGAVSTSAATGARVVVRVGGRFDPNECLDTISALALLNVGHGSRRPQSCRSLTPTADVSAAAADTGGFNGWSQRIILMMRRSGAMKERRRIYYSASQRYGTGGSAASQ
jgi:hypothetical protein